MYSISEKGTLLLTSTAHGINDGNNIALPVIYAYMASTFSFSLFYIGLFGGIFWAISALASPVVSYLADRSGNSIRVMGLGILLWGFGLDLFGIGLWLFNSNLLIIGASVVICGFSSAFYHPLGGTAVSKAYGGNAGTALGINGSMGSIGRALYPSLTLILFGILGNSPISMAETIFIISLVAILNAIPSLMSVPVVNDEKLANNNKSDIENSVKNKIVVVILFLTFITFMRSVFTQGVTQFLPTLLVSDFHYDFNSNFGFILTVTLAPPILGQPIFGLLSDKFDRRLLFGLSNIGSAISFLLFLEIPNLIWLIIFGFFTYSLFPLMISLIGDLIPKSSSNMSSGVVWGIGSAGGGALGPTIVGIFAGFMGLTSALLSVVVLGFLSGLLVVFIPKSQKRSKTKLFN